MIHLTHEQIAKRAYEIFLRSGSQPGRDEENWLAAETELKREIEAAKALKKSGALITALTWRVSAPRTNAPPSGRAPVKNWALPLADRWFYQSARTCLGRRMNSF